MLAPLALAACATATAPPPPSGGVCRTENLDQFAGRPATQEMGAEMLRVSEARNLRWVSYGTIITTEYLDGRLTVFLTPDNRVYRANCG